jgi:hypothetical protein
MKRIPKFILYTTELLLVLLILLYFGIRIWLIARIDSVVENKPYPELVKAIKITPPLPQKLFDAYERVYNFNHRKTTNLLLTEMSWRIWDFKYHNTSCGCVQVSFPIFRKTSDKLTIGLALDHEVGPRKCLEYHLNRQDFLFNQIGVRNAAKFYFEKDLDDLAETELLTLCIMMKNPSLYNPITHPERILRELSEIHQSGE